MAMALELEVEKHENTHDCVWIPAGTTRSDGVKLWKTVHRNGEEHKEYLQSKLLG